MGNRNQLTRWLIFSARLNTIHCSGMAMGDATRRQAGDAPAKSQRPGPRAGRAVAMAHRPRDHAYL